MVEALMGRPAACKRPRGCALGRPWHRGRQARRTDQKQHSTWDRYTHISLTLSQVTQSRTERNKNKRVSESTAQAGAAPRPQREGREADGQMDTRNLPSASDLVCV